MPDGNFTRLDATWGFNTITMMPWGINTMLMVPVGLQDNDNDARGPCNGSVTALVLGRDEPRDEASVNILARSQITRRWNCHHAAPSCFDRTVALSCGFFYTYHEQK